MMVRENCAVRADHVKDPFTAGPQINPLRAAGKPFRTPPLRQRLFVHPGFPDDVSRHLYRSLQHHGPPGHTGQIVETRAETFLITIAHILRQRGKLHRYGQAATLFRSLKIGSYQRCRLRYAAGRDYLVIHAAAGWLKLQPAAFTANIRLAGDLAERNFATAQPAVRFQELHGDRGRGRGPHRPGGG